MSSFTSPLVYSETGKYTSGGQMIYKIEEEFSYAIGSLYNPWKVITVPVGFETDLATMPGPLKYIFRPDGPWAKAAVIHDYLYVSETCDGATAMIFDVIFFEALLVLKFNIVVAYLFYYAVRIFQGLKDVYLWVKKRLDFYKNGSSNNKK